MAKTIHKVPDKVSEQHGPNGPVAQPDQVEELVRREDGAIPGGRDRIMVSARVTHVRRGTPAWEK
jgi:hypothetical protein